MAEPGDLNASQCYSRLTEIRLIHITLGLCHFVGKARMDTQFLMAMMAIFTLMPIALFFDHPAAFIQSIVITRAKE